MVLEARKLAGRLTENQTIIETKIDLGDVAGSDIDRGVFSLEKVGGVHCFLGLDSPMETQLNFKRADEANADGDQDYTSTNIFVTHKIVGDSSGFRVVFTYFLKSEVAAHNAALDTWWNDGNTSESASPVDNTAHTIKSGIITATWTADADGDWT